MQVAHPFPKDAPACINKIAHMYMCRCDIYILSIQHAHVHINTIVYQLCMKLGETWYSS